MTNGWQTVQLGKVLTRVKSELTIDDSVTYKQVTVRLWNKGVVLRGEQEGSAIKTKRQFYVKTGQLVMSRIDVRNGAIGLVPKELDGAIVSNDFWVYDFDESQVYPEFLALYVKTPNFLEEVNRTSSGTTHRIRAEETPFLEIQIPLPPLTEQRRIVAHIESLAARVNEAQRLREEADEESNVIFDSKLETVYQKLLKDYKSMPLAELVEPDRGISYGVVLLGESQEGGVPTLRAGDLQRYVVSTSNLKTIDPEVAAKYQRTKLRGGELLLKIRGGYGDVAVCPSKLRNGNVSREIAVIPLLENVLPEFGMYILSAPTSQEKMSAKLRGTSYQGLNLSDVRKLPVPLPPLDEQRRIVAYLDGLQAKVNALRELQSQSQEELDALLPSVLDKAFKDEL